jgi:signal transduction histidine kinase
MARWHFPSIAESLRVRRFRWPLFVLLASIGLTAVAAFDAQRVVRSQRRLAERALTEYASFAAWSYAQHLLLTLNAIEREAVGAVNHGDNLHTNRMVPTARDLAHYLPWDEACMCHRSFAGPNPEAFFAVDIRQHELNIGVNTHENPDQGWEVDRPMPEHMRMDMLAMPPETRETGGYTAAEQRWLLDSLTQRIRSEPGVDHGFHFVVANGPEGPRIFAYTLMPTSWGDTMVYGARYSRAAFVRILSGVLDANTLMPKTFVDDRRNRDVLSVIVRDSAGHALFATDSTLSLASHVNLPSRAGALSIDASVRPEIAGALLIGGLPASRLPFLLGLLGLAAALSIVAVMQLRREGELAQLRGDFVSSVSHELRTPVAQIRLYLETLQLGRAATDEQRQWSLGHIERETTRLAHLVENVLRFSTLGREDPTAREPTDVGTEVARIAAEFRPLAASRRATVCVTARTTPPVALRPDALRHIVLNLLDNAVKYGPVGQTVNVTVDADDENVLIAVSDEGPGIAATDRERIWRAFTRGPTAQASGGSGIGLTIVREVADAHGGRAEVQETPRGARFVITLPIDPPAAGVT